MNPADAGEGVKMKRLFDTGYWMVIVGWVCFASLQVGQSWFEFDQIFVHIGEVGSSLFIVSIFSVMLGMSANKAASYANALECAKDINADTRAFAVMLIITVGLIFFPLGIYVSESFAYSEISILKAISNDLKVSYIIFFLFHFIMTILRNWERRMTVKNCLDRMFEMNPTILSTGRPGTLLLIEIGKRKASRLSKQVFDELGDKIFPGHWSGKITFYTKNFP